MKNNDLAQQSEARENRLVRKDFIYVVFLNLVLFALMIGLFFWNRSTGELDRIFSQIIKF
jgi:hypothetical protein